MKRAPADPIRVLVFSTLYPSEAQSHHGVFVENRLRHVVQTGEIEAKVVAPVPWFPSRNPRFGRYAEFAAAPAVEKRHGLDVLHPRYPVIPKAGMTMAPALLYAWSRGTIARLRSSGYDFDLIDAHYFFPDGVAAVMLGQAFNKPVTVTARGTDINLIPSHALARRMVRWAARRAGANIAVCQALKTAMVDLGMAAETVTVLRNGVDLAQFRPVGGAAYRQRTGLTSPVLLSVGGLIPRKGHDLIIRALAELPGATLLIAGAGPEDARLRGLAHALNLDARVRFLGPVPHESLREIYTAADCLILASDREGWPNVLLESMACGTPVAATDIWGTPEVVAHPAAGRLIPQRTPEAIAATVRALLADPPTAAETRAYAERFSWDETTRGQIEIFRRLAGRAAERAPQPSEAPA